jgi:hypothetical protein
MYWDDYECWTEKSLRDSYQYCLGRLKKTTKTLQHDSLSMFEIRTGYLQNALQTPCRFDNEIGMMCFSDCFDNNTNNF